MARRIPGTGPGRAGKPASRSGTPKGDFRPTKEDILKYIHENPDRSGKREIAKAFSLKGDDRVRLKDMLRDLQDEGLLNKERKRLTRAGSLPHVSVLRNLLPRRRRWPARPSRANGTSVSASRRSLR